MTASPIVRQGLLDSCARIADGTARTRDRFGDQTAAARQQAIYQSFLAELLFIECEAREVRCKARSVKQAGAHSGAR